VPKLVIFGIALNLPKRGIPLKQFFFIKFGLGMEFQVRTLIPNFIFLAVKNVGLQSQKSRKIEICRINLSLRENFGGPQKKLNMCTTTNIPVCNDTIIVLKITLLHSVSVITNFVIPNGDKTRQTKTSHFVIYSRRANHDPHHAWHGDRGGPSQFCVPLTFFDPISSFAARGF